MNNPIYTRVWGILQECGDFTWWYFWWGVCFGGGSYCPIPDELYFIRKMSQPPEFVFPSNPPSV